MQDLLAKLVIEDVLFFVLGYLLGTVVEYIFCRILNEVHLKDKFK